MSLNLEWIYSTSYYVLNIDRLLIDYINNDISLSESYILKLKMDSAQNKSQQTSNLLNREELRY